jgi:hypothetical protein
MMDRFGFWQKWLLFFALLVAAFGLLLAFGYTTPWFAWMRTGINLPFFYSAREITPAISASQAWMVALLGAVMAAWAITIAFVAAVPFKRRESWAWVCLAVSVLAWFILDESFSLYYQVYLNAGLNVVFLAALALPLVCTRSAFLSLL